MRAVPHERYEVTKVLRETVSLCTLLVRDRLGEAGPLVLKLYVGLASKAHRQALAEEIGWHRGLEHPHLLPIADAGVWRDADLFIVRRYVPESFTTSDATTAQIKQLIDAVNFLHEHGRVHGSIRPSNVLMDHGDVRLADPRVVAQLQLTTSDDVHFTAPERFSSGLSTKESDYYSLGAILYRIRAGRDPFEDPILENLTIKYKHATIPRLAETSTIPEPLSIIVDGLLHRNPSRRSTAFQELLRHLEINKPSTAVRAPFIGRRETLALLQQQLISQGTDSLQVILLDGEVGIGKSRLIEELQFRSGFSKIDISSTTCNSSDEGSFAPVLHLLRVVVRKRALMNRSSIRQELGPFANTLLPLLEEVPSKDTVEYPDERVIQDLVGSISFLSRKHTLRFVIEDIQNADQGTVAFLSRLCYRASELNCRLLLTCRRSNGLKVVDLMKICLASDLKSVSLNQLAPPETAALLGFLEADPANEHVWEKAGGNPLYLLVHTQHKKANRKMEIVKVVERMREELRPPFLKVAQALAVSRSVASADLIARVLSTDTNSTLERLQWLKEAGIVREVNDGFEFRMEDLPSAIERGLSPRARRDLHMHWYETLQSAKGALQIDPRCLADHAYEACLWEQAAAHYRELARLALQRGESASALEFYNRVNRSLGKANEKPNVEDLIAFAECLGKAGKRTAAEQMYESLLKDSNINEDVRLRLAILSKFAQLNLDRAPSDRALVILQQAVRNSKNVPNSAAVLYSQLGLAFVASGDLTRANEALQEANLALADCSDSKARLSTQAASGFLLLNTGYFREALGIFKTVFGRNPKMSPAILTNTAVCLEHLGHLKAAYAVQGKAYHLAEKAGNFVGQVCCLANMGLFKVKVGDLKSARSIFKDAWRLAHQSNAQGKTSIAVRTIEAEEACLHVIECQYALALEQLRTVLAADDLHKCERLQLQLLLCEVLLLQGERRLPSSLTNEFAKCPLARSPLVVAKRELLRSREEQNPRAARTILVQAISGARAAGLLYEACRLGLEYSLRSTEGGDPAEAKAYAEEAFKIAKKNGYRPLQAQAMMLKGLASGHQKEKEHWLMQAFKLASEIGMPELVAESAYHIGVHLLKEGHFATGKEYLLKSTAITSELAEQIPARRRPRYLGKPWRKDARKRLEECVQQQSTGLPRIQALTATPHKENQFFSALYHVSVIAGTATGVQTFVSELLQALDASVRRPIALALTRDDQTAWHSSRMDLTDDLKKQVLATAARAKDRVIFDYRDRARTKGTIAWIPIRSAQYSGGFFVACREHETMVEREMEFLTVLGNVTGNALDQLDGRARLSPPLLERNEFCGIIGKSRAIRELCQQIETAAGNNATVLIEGETGAGKEVVARAIHKLSNRADSPFIAVDCGAIPEGLIESELFGAKRGAYTGAITDRAGLFEAANHGTLFLDEISNTNLGVQAKLLRVLQEREVRRVGETRGRPVDVRLIAATNRSLMSLVQEGAFRQDLLYRLNVLQLAVPPLRSRREDIPLLAAYFLERLNSAQKTNKVFGPTALDSLMIHTFPGNVRELQNVVERSFFIAKGKTISTAPIELTAGAASLDEVKAWFKDLSEGRKNFWTAIHERYKRRDIPREKIVALVDLGLRATRGSYKDLASLFRVGDKGYRRLMDFLRRSECLLDFRPYRKTAATP